MERIPAPSKEALVLSLPRVCKSPGLTVKTNQFEEARDEVRQNLSMRYSLVGSEGNSVLKHVSFVQILVEPRRRNWLPVTTVLKVTSTTCGKASLLA